MNSDAKNGLLGSKDAKSIRKELQEIRNRINFLLDSLDSGDINDKYGVSAMADALQEKTAGIGGASSNSLDPSDSRSNAGMDNMPSTNGPFQNNISSENSKEFDPFNTAQKPSVNTITQPQQRIPDDQASVASHSSSSAVRPDTEVSNNSGGGFQRPDVTSIPPNNVGMPQQPQQPGAYQGAYNPAGYPMPQQAMNQQMGAPNTQAGTAPQQMGTQPIVPPSTNVQSQPQVGQQSSVASSGYNPYPPQQQHGYQPPGTPGQPGAPPGAMPPQSQGQTAGTAQVPPASQQMYQQQFQQQQGYPAGAQPTQGGPPRGPPIGPPQTMTAQGANPYGMPPRGQSPLTRYPQAPAYR